MDSASNAGPAPFSPEELLEHVAWVRRLASQLVDDPDRAEDVAQETWKRALESPPRHARNLRGWLSTVACNAARHLGRSETSHTLRERRSAQGRTAPAADEVAELTALQRDVVEQVLRLEDPYRDALLAAFLLAQWNSMTSTRGCRTRTSTARRLPTGHASCSARPGGTLLHETLPDSPTVGVV